MMPQKVLQPSFSGGVFSPSLYSRVDLAKYSTGLKTAKNFFVHPHGGASNRQGTGYVAAAKIAAKKCRLVPFEFSLEQAYALEFGEGYVRFFSDGSPIRVTTGFTEWNPASSYLSGAYVKISPYSVFWITQAAGTIAVSPESSCASVINVLIDVNTSDALSVTVSGSGPYIHLANTTPAKNSAALIQAAVRAANPAFALWTVTEDATYAANRPVTVAAPGYTTFKTAAYYGYPTGYFVAQSSISASKHPSVPSSGSVWLNTDLLEVATPYLEADLPELKFAQSADVLYITHPDYAPRMLVRYGADVWTLETYAFENGPFMLSNLATNSTLKVYEASGTNKIIYSNVGIFNANLVGALFQIVHPVEGQKVSTAFTSVTAGTSIKCGNTWRLVTRGTWAASIQIEKSTDDGATWKVIRGFSSSSDFNGNTYGDVDDPCLVRVNCTAYTSGTCNVDLTSDAYEHKGLVRIASWAPGIDNPEHFATCDILKTLAGAAIETSDWSEGSWSNHRGWPRAVTFHQDRLCFAGTNSEPQTIWMTETGRYTSFARSTPIVDSDGISVNLPARKMNGIKNLTVLNDMVAMTTATEWSIGAGSGAPITPTSVQTACQGYRGCSDMAPVTVGNRILYFQPMGSILRDMGYSINADGYDSDDITIMASHFFDNCSVVDMAYQQEPDSLLWCVRSDGVLLSLTYMREQEVFAWTEHNTDGLFESVCSIPGDGYNEVWFVVKRTVNGAVVRYIERLATRMTTTVPADQFFVDSGLTITNAPASTAVTGLSHLEGKTVAVLADGFVRSGLVVTGGAITLPEAASKVIVGLPYTCDLETLNVELNLNTGTTQGSKVKISDVTVRFLNTRGGSLGPDVAGLDPIVLNDSVDLGTAEPLHSVDYQHTLASGYDVGGRILYRQTDPLPVTILAIIPVVTVGG